ncbi:hypothetical protein [Argonema antarcticum]|uniref:hypothetical protein n=1 Tax=Argonema antarcticum TaxID=2942763 RepID=UPI002012B597|nr:hypothetical protein [Argonema antarcticum]MCL1475402.1 hypothetical protein [Argonema antarcticum A004/B2]
MKLNLTVAVTLLLLVLMLGAGFVSGMWGFALGHEALKGVSQPDARPITKTKNLNDTPPGAQAVVMLKEADIIKTVKVMMQKSKQRQPEKKNNTDNRTKLLSAVDPTQSDAAPAGFPIVSKDKGVTLEIRSVRQQQGSLLLDVSLKNESSQSVKFLYSFLDVTDDRGRPLSASAEGLPGELPANGEAFSGTVSIPTTVLEGASRISLTLTDYPDQQLRLQTSGIPVR